MLLTPEQLVQLTGYRRPSAQVRALRQMGIRHWVRLDGKPVVDDSALTSKSETGPEPAWERING